MDNNIRDVIITLTDMKNKLSNLNIKDDNKLMEINNLIQLYLDEHPCPHNIIYDYIDLPPEGGKNIKFCDICWKTFN